MDSKTKSEINNKSSKGEQNGKLDPEKDKLLNIAIKFLGNPKVINVSWEKKVAFLKKKGLTEEEALKAQKMMEEQKKEEEEKQKQKPEENNNNTKNKENNENFQKNEESLQERIEKAKKTGFLSLKGLNITELPNEIFEIDNLQTLVISDNKLSSIPAQIKKFSNLRKLIANNCSLNETQISNEISQLQNLEDINFSRNNLTAIDLFVPLRNLKKLDLSFNEISDIPEEIGNLENLQLLNLRKNQIAIIPESIQNLTKLKALLLTENNLDEEIVNIIRKSGVKGLKDYFN